MAKIILCFLATFLVLTSSHANQPQKMNGWILRKHNGELHLNLKNGQKIKISPASREVSQILKNLSTGDMIYTTAIAKDKVYDILRIDYIGLRKMLGLWISNDNTLYDFRNFEEMEKIRFEGEPQRAISEKYNYSLSPTDNASYDFIYSNKNKVELASLVPDFDSPNKAFIVLIDEETGETEEIVELRLVNRRK